MCETSKILLICAGKDCNFQEETMQGDKIETHFEKNNCCPECGCCNFRIRELSGGALV